MMAIVTAFYLTSDVAYLIIIHVISHVEPIIVIDMKNACVGSLFKAPTVDFYFSYMGISINDVELDLT